MTVGQLIDRLKLYGLDTKVLVEGYEEGYNEIDIKNVRSLPVTKRAKHEFWEGPYVQDSDGELVVVIER